MVPKLLPHEKWFGLMLLVIWLRLLMAVGFFSTDALVFLTLIVINVALIVYADQKPNAWRWRLWFYPIAFNVVFQQLRTAIAAIEPMRFDVQLQAIDQWLVGGNLSLLTQHWMHPALTELLSICYILFFPYLLFSILWYFVRGPLELTKQFCVGLFSLYGIGFLGYMLVPAVGPYVAMASQFSEPLVGGPMTRWNAELVVIGSNGVDVFPSLHCAVSSFLLMFDFQHKRWRFWVYLLPAIGLWISTIYLRYHYFLDVLAGFALAVVAIAISRAWKSPPPAGEG